MYLEQQIFVTNVTESENQKTKKHKQNKNKNQKMQHKIVKLQK
jgi:hypothetical protein